MLKAPSGSAGKAGVAVVPGRFAHLLVVVAAVVLVALAALFAAGSFLPYETVKERLDAFASDDDADFTRERFDAIVLQLRIAAILLTAAGAAAYAGRRRLAELAEGLLSSTAAETRAGLGTLRRALASESRLHLGALAGVLVAAVLVRLEFLFQPMRYDEAGTYVHYASPPLYVGLTSYTAPNNHLLHTLLVHLSTGVAGNHPWAIRLPALLAGIALVPAAYLAARLLFDRNTALLGAALVATSSVLIEYSTNARGYSIVALLFALLLALGTYLRRNSSPAAWATFAVLAALALYTVPTALYAVGAAATWMTLLLVAEGRRRLLRTRLLPALAAAGALTLFLYAPVLAASGVHSLVGNAFVEPETWSDFARDLPGSLADTFAGWHRDQPLPVWTLLAGAFLVGLGLHPRLSGVRLSPALGPLLFIPPVLVLQRVVPFERVWLFLLPLYLLTAAGGVVLLLRLLPGRENRALAATAIAVALCAGLAVKAVDSQAVYRSEDTSTFRDGPAVAAYLEQVLRPGDRVLAAPPADLILEYYLDAKGLDAGRLLYTDFEARRLFAVVKEGPREYPLAIVISWRLPPQEARTSRPVLLRRFPHARVYELEGSR